MAPVLSLTKEKMDAIRDVNYLRVVKIWQLDAMGSESAHRTGFVLQTYVKSCAVVTVREGLDLGQGKSIRVQFQTGVIHQGTIHSGQPGQPQSKLVAIILRGLPLQPLSMVWSAAEAIKCQTVAHIGIFHGDLATLGVSSGSVGLVNHTMLPRTVEAHKTFVHCCSQKEHMIGAPVCNTNGHFVGINIIKKNKNMFFALDMDQVANQSS